MMFSPLRFMNCLMPGSTPADDADLVARNRALDSLRFMVDRMLIKLGKYLRILGYDASWHFDIGTRDQVITANQQSRVFLTRNRHIAEQHAIPEKSLLITDHDPVAQLVTVVKTFNLDPRKGLFSRCIRCNRKLETVQDKESIRGRVHPNVYTNFEQFYRCPACGTVFWKGGHVQNTCRKLAPVLNPEAQSQADDAE